MFMNKIPMTAEGYTKLQDELKKLTSEDRPKILKQLLKLEATVIYPKMQNINMLKNSKV